jgi:hypothetical protein
LDTPAGRDISKASNPTVSEPETPAPRSEWRKEAAWLLAFVPLTVAFTWPLTARFATALAGDEGDAWQNLWNIGWIRHALRTLQNPFYTHDLWHPTGTTLVFQTFDLPDAIWGAALLGWLGPFRTYNLVVLWTFFSSAAAMYVLGRGTGASRPAAFLSGCAYAFSTYHFAHAYAHLHLLAMQWVPLYVLAFLRVLVGGGWRWAVLAGVLLTLASLASWYYLVGAFILSSAAVIAWLIRERGRGIPGFAVRGALLCGVFLLLIAPLGVAMQRERAREPVEGSHPAWFFSADAESFVFPSEVQALSAFSDRHQRWTGNKQENGSYLGTILILLALVGVVLRAPRAGAYALAATIGAVLSLGPGLHVGGRLVNAGVLPYERVVQWIPILQFMGVPVRFAFAATFGLAAALAPTLDALRRWLPWWLLAPVAAAGILEHTPHAFPTYVWPTPEPVLAWAEDPTPFAVIDGCRDNRHMWHQFLHGHPIFDGYLSRLASRLQLELDRDPIAGPLRTGIPPSHVEPFTTTTLDFPFTDRVIDGAERFHFSFDVRGLLQVPTSGKVGFRLLADDGATLAVDGKRVVDDGGRHPPREQRGFINLAAGMHTLDVHYEQWEGGAVFRAWWTPPDQPERIIGPPDVPGGFEGSIHFQRRDTRLSREDALKHLAALRVKYILQPDEDSSYLAERQLGLTPFYRGAKVRIYEVPLPDSTSSAAQR